MTQEKKIRRFYWVLAAAVLFTVLITWLILTLTQPVLTDSAIHVWTITQTPAEYQDKININTATIDELTYAEGIGPSTAKNIYDYLQQKGPVEPHRRFRQRSWNWREKTGSVEKNFLCRLV